MLLLRNPYAWLPSVRRLPFTSCSNNSRLDQFEHNFSTWLRRPFAVYGMCKPGRMRSTPMAVWNEIALAYRSLKWQPAVLLRDDEMLSQPVLLAKLREIASVLGTASRRISRLPRELAPVRRGRAPWTPQDYERERRRMVDRPWLIHYTIDDLSWINSQLSDEAVQGMGFERLHTIPCTPRGRECDRKQAVGWPVVCCAT